MQINIKELEEQFGKPISEFNQEDWWIISKYHDLLVDLLIEFAISSYGGK
jgi:hypothetical protein